MISLKEIQTILNNNDPQFIEELALKSKRLTEQYFGRTISLYTPLYLSNYCSSDCIYCGFNKNNKIKRFKLTDTEIESEMNAISKQSIENILLLTGESYSATDNQYLLNAVRIAKKYFSSISLEVHPMDENDYKLLYENGVDGLTIYQETYDKNTYSKLHIIGKKADYEYRYQTPQRAAKAGIRYISLGILLGLHDIAEDLFNLFNHLKLMEKNFPAVEYSLSFPRIKSIKGADFMHCDVDDKTFTKIICLTRILFPRVGINLSTRENQHIRNNLLGLGVTRISAGSKTTVGGYCDATNIPSDPQFDIEDDRSIYEIITFLKNNNFDPVFTDWRKINTSL